MKNIFSRALQFIKENPSIIFSLVFVVLIPAAFFYNTYTINSKYEKNIDKITQRNAVLVENIVNYLIEEKNTDEAKIQSAMERIKQENEEITSISFIRFISSQNSFQVAASSDRDLIGKNQDDSIQNSIAWRKSESIAFLDSDENGRFWKVTKIITDSTGEKAGLITANFSLKDSDALIGRTINSSYWVLIVTMLVAILMVSNQTKLFGYALSLSKIKEIDKMKDMFISMASHELRSPLTAVKGYLEFLQEKEAVASDEESKHYVENISISVDRLQNLVNDILEVSRVEGNRLPMEITVFDPNSIISQSIEEMKSQAVQKGLVLSDKLLEAPIQISADVSRLKQILVNLISNSIKYTEKGSVDVSSSIKGNEFLITVADTGIGISAENLSHLFQKFYRIQNEKTKGIIGTGLGLWITLEIAKRMKGNITVESIEGVGSHFTLHLPIKK